MNYTHLTREERYQIYALKKAGHKQSEIANVLERSGSTISRELARNRGQRGYRPKQAHNKAGERRAINARQIDDATWQFAQGKLLQQWSPEQISGHLQAEGRDGISHETVYQRVYADKRAGGLLWKNLRCQKLRKKRYGKLDRRGTIPNRLSIDERPAIVELRERIGDWETDTVIGKNHRQAIVSLVERKTGFTLIEKVERKTAQAVSEAMTKLLQPYRSKVCTVTSDNGREFARHEEIAQRLQADFIFRSPLCIMGARHEREHEWVDPAVPPQKPGFHHHYTTGNRYGDGSIEQPAQKATWIPDTLSGILQIFRR